MGYYLVKKGLMEKEKLPPKVTEQKPKEQKPKKQETQEEKRVKQVLEEIVKQREEDGSNFQPL